MSAGIDIDMLGKNGVETSGLCAVVAIYQDDGSRDLLLQLWNSLIFQFGGDIDFHFDWCRSKYLVDPEVAMEVADKATRADLILLAPKSSDLPPYVQGWCEGWLPHREASAGALILVQPASKSGWRSVPMQNYLRLAAMRAHLDYLRLSSLQPLGLANFAGDSSMTQLQMEQILAEENPPVHWGINE